jgi:hypothetical protein
MNIDHAREAVDHARRDLDHAEGCIQHGAGPPDWRYINADNATAKLRDARLALSKMEREMTRCAWCDNPAERVITVRTDGGVTIKANICRTHG